MTRTLSATRPERAAPGIELPAISARSVSKDFVVPEEPYGRVRDHFVHPLRHSGSNEVLEALRDVSFDIRPGEFFGIAGKNGSGKTTLLRCLSGIYPVDGGELAAHGRLAPFIELGVGFSPEMSARDNVLVNAVLMGMTRREARERLEDIIAFAELEDFAGMKLKNCSAGMNLRLAFSVTVQVDADILLFDEVLAVGDSSFQRKCDERFERLRAEGRTIVLVTHDMSTITRRCDRAILLHHGRVIELGHPEAVASSYERINREDSGAGALRGQAPARPRREARRRSTAPLRARARRLAAVTGALALAEFRLRYLDSALSYLWAVMRPLAFFGVLWVVFTQIGSFDSGVEHYPIYLLTAIVLWTFFSESTHTAIGSLVRGAPLLRTLPLPRVAFPLAVTLTSLLDLCVTLIAVLAIMLASGIEPRVGWLEFPLLVALLTLLVAGLAMLLSVLYVRLRDVDHVWHVVRQTLFYLSPIIYVAAVYPAAVEKVAMANPLAAIFTEARHALIDPDAPTAAAAIGGSARLLVPLGVVAATFGLGLWAFQRESARAAERL